VYSPASTETLELFAPFPEAKLGAARATRGIAAKKPITARRPLHVSLQRETGHDVRAKEMGINREVEVGDPAFDGKIYIDSRCEDEVIRALLADPEARAAVLGILELEAVRIILDDKKGRVSLLIVEFTKRNPDAARAERMLDGLVRLVDALPPIEAQAEKRAPDWFWHAIIAGAILAVFGIMVAPVTYFQFTPEHCKVWSWFEKESRLECARGPDCCTPATVGLLSGGGVGLALCALFFLTIRGRSDSFARMICTMIVTTLFSLEAGLVIARLVW
jgi:hypothetical protein